MKKLLTAVIGFAALAVSAETLTLYTSQPNKDAQKTVDAFMAENPGIEVKWVRDGTTKMMAKLQAELASGVVNPDVLLIADSVNMESLKKDDRLLPYQSAHAKNFDASFYDAEGYYHGTKLITTGIVYNDKAEQKPASWADYSKPEYKNLIAMPSPLYSGAALINLASITSEKTLGWDYVKSLAANSAVAQGGNGGVLKAVASGQKAYGVIVGFLAIRESVKGSPITFVFPTEGVSYITEPVAIMKGTKNEAAAKKFVDFLLSKKGQELASSMGYLPAQADVAAPKGFPARDQIKFLPFDAQKALENAENNKKQFAEVFGVE